MKTAFSVGPGARPNRKNDSGMNKAPHHRSGVHRGVSGRPVGNSCGMSVSIGPTANEKDHEVTQARATAPGSEPGAMITARVAYSWTKPPYPIDSPATRRSHPIAFRGCRRAMRRPAVATVGATTSLYPRKPQLSGTWASRLTKMSAAPAAASVTAPVHKIHASRREPESLISGATR